MTPYAAQLRASEMLADTITLRTHAGRYYLGSEWREWDGERWLTHFDVLGEGLSANQAFKNLQENMVQEEMNWDDVPEIAAQIDAEMKWLAEFYAEHAAAGTMKQARDMISKCGRQ